MDKDTRLILSAESAILDVVVDTRAVAVARAREIAREKNEPVWIYTLDVQVNQDGSID